MGIQQIFVSHAGKDAAVATELAQQLRNAGHDARIDTRDLALGDNAIEFMNEGISNAAAVIILFPGTALRRSGRNSRSTRRGGTKSPKAAGDVSSSVWMIRRYRRHLDRRLTDA